MNGTSRLEELRRWQALRLASTYDDFRRDARYAPAVEFFLNDVYGPHDFTSRNHEIARATQGLRRTLPHAPLRAMHDALELDALTEELDRAMADALGSEALNGALYARAYRAVGRRDARARQVELVVAVGKELQRAVSHVWVGALLKAARAPARAAGFSTLQNFLERGYRAFKRIADAGPLLAAIRDRETALLESLFSGAADPFAHRPPGEPP